MGKRGKRDVSLEPVWRALANATRRAILDHVTDEPRTTGELVQKFPELSRYAVMQHLRVLERCRLLVPRRVGRHKLHYMNPIPIQEIYHRWVRRYQEPWAESLVALKQELESGSRRRRPKDGKAG